MSKDKDRAFVNGKDYRVFVEDGSVPADSVRNEVEVEMREYRVLAEGGIFKYGTLWGKGDVVKMNPETAKNFIAIGEVEPLQEGSGLEEEAGNE